MEASCLELSIEGERLLKAGDYEGAIKHFEAGLRAGGDNDEVWEFQLCSGSPRGRFENFM